MDAFANCGICQDILCDDRCLPCLHSFCLECLRQLVAANAEKEKPLCCPICTAQFDVSAIGDVALLARLPLASNVANRKRKIQSIPDINAINCNWCLAKEATHFCTNCSEFCCAACQLSHKRARISQCHTIVSADIGWTLFSSLSSDVVFCETHPDQQLSCFCTHHRQLLCGRCAIEKHADSKDCAIETLDVATAREKGILVSSLDSAKARAGELDQLIQEAKVMLEGLESATTQACMTAEAAFELTHTSLEQAKHACLQGIQDARDARHKTLQGCKNAAEFFRHELQSLVQLGSLLSGSESCIELLTSGQPVISRLETLVGAKSEALPSSSPFNLPKNPQQIFGLISDSIQANVSGRDYAAEFGPPPKPCVGHFMFQMSHFMRPSALAVTSSGEYLVSDQENHRVLHFDRDGKYMRHFGSKASHPGALCQPRGLAMDPCREDEFAVIDSGSRSVHVLSFKNGYVRSFGEGLFGTWCAKCIAMDPKTGHYVVHEEANNRVFFFDAYGNHLRTCELHISTKVHQIAFLSDGLLVVLFEYMVWIMNPETLEVDRSIKHNNRNETCSLVVDKDDNLLISNSKLLGIDVISTKTCSYMTFIPTYEVRHKTTFLSINPQRQVVLLGGYKDIYLY